MGASGGGMGNKGSIGRRRHLEERGIWDSAFQKSILIARVLKVANLD